MASSARCSIWKGPATAAPVGISIAMTTPSGVGSTIQLNPRSVTKRSSTSGFLARSMAEQDRLQHVFDVVIGPRGGRGRCLEALGDRVVPLAQDDFHVKRHHRPSIPAPGSQLARERRGARDRRLAGEVPADVRRRTGLARRHRRDERQRAAECCLPRARRNRQDDGKRPVVRRNLRDERPRRARRPPHRRSRPARERRARPRAPPSSSGWHAPRHRRAAP